MTPEERAENQSIAERLIKYSDTIVAASVVSVVGLGFAIADADIRPSMEWGVFIILGVTVLVGALFIGILVLLRRWEVALKSGLPLSTKALAYGRHLHVARVVVVGICLLLSVALVFAM